MSPENPENHMGKRINKKNGMTSPSRKVKKNPKIDMRARVFERPKFKRNAEGSVTISMRDSYMDPPQGRITPMETPCDSILISPMIRNKYGYNIDMAQSETTLEKLPTNNLKARAAVQSNYEINMR